MPLLNQSIHRQFVLPYTVQTSPYLIHIKTRICEICNLYFINQTFGQHKTNIKYEKTKVCEK